MIATEHVKEAIPAYEKALAALERGHLPQAQEHYRLSFKLGELMIKEQKDPVRARQYLEQALASSAAPPNSPERVKCMAALAVCMVEEGRLDEAFEQAQNALAMAEGFGFADGIASASGALCSVHEAHGNLASYAQVSRRQMSALDQCNDVFGIFEAYAHLEIICIIRGDFEQAERFALSGMELCQKFNAPGWESTLLASYIYVLDKRGRWPEALEHGRRILPLFDRVGCSICFMYILASLAQIEVKRGHREQSRQHLDSALSIALQLGFDPMATARWRFIGHATLEAWEEAWTMTGEARAAGQAEISAVGGSAVEWSRLLPEVAARVGRWSEAERLAEQATAFFQKQAIPFGVASGHFAFGLAQVGQGRWAEGLAVFEQALGSYQSLSDPWDVANTQYEMALIYLSRRQNDDLTQAQQLLQQAHANFKNLEAEPSIAKVVMALEQLR